MSKKMPDSASSAAAAAHALLSEMLTRNPRGCSDSDFKAAGFSIDAADRLAELESALRGIESALIIGRALSVQAEAVEAHAGAIGIPVGQLAEDLEHGAISLARAARNILADFAESHQRARRVVTDGAHA